MKILSTADWHIILDKKKIPNEWQINRFKEFFDKIRALEPLCDIHIIAGDVFDRRPTLEEAALFADFANRASIRTIIIPGNHEATKKGETFLRTYIEHEKSINNPNVEVYVDNTRIEHKGQWFQLFPYNMMQLDKLPAYVEGDILVTHIRGAVPPHITAEYDFEKIKPWGLTLLGDLHFNHRYQSYNVYYPGSPMNVVFDRDEDRKYGINVIDFNGISNYSVNFMDLDLPKLIRRTIKVGQEMVKDNRNHVVYEVTGSVDELAKIEKSELLDKKLVHAIEEGSKLDLTNKASLSDELKAWLEYTGVEDIQGVMDEFASLKIA
jgi:DNA repair exonuclease SbcCD nuclease subunit